METASEIQTVVSNKFGKSVKVFFYRWFSLIVLLYGLLGFFFYLFLLLSHRFDVITDLPFHKLSKAVLWNWFVVFSILHFAVFSGGVLMLLFNKVWGFAFFFVGMSSILLANAIINGEIYYTSWAVLLVIAFALWKWRKEVGKVSE